MCDTRLTLLVVSSRGKGRAKERSEARGYPGRRVAAVLTEQCRGGCDSALGLPGAPTFRAEVPLGAAARLI